MCGRWQECNGLVQGAPKARGDRSRSQRSGRTKTTRCTGSRAVGMQNGPGPLAATLTGIGKCPSAVPLAGAPQRLTQRTVVTHKLQSCAMGLCGLVSTSTCTKCTVYVGVGKGTVGSRRVRTRLCADAWAIVQVCMCTNARMCACVVLCLSLCLSLCVSVSVFLSAFACVRICPLPRPRGLG